jgi:hypothetical protein
MGQNQPLAWFEEEKKKQLSELSAQFLWNWVAMIFDVFIQEAGPERTLSAIRPHIKHSGMAQAQNALKFLGKQKSELENLTAPWMFVYGTLFGEDFLTVVLKETCAVAELRKCPISYSRPEICIALSHYVSEGWCEAINTEYETVWTQHQTEGAPSCKFILKRKDAYLSSLEFEEEKAIIPYPELSEEMRNYIRYDAPAESGIIFTTAFLEVSGSERALKLLRKRAGEWGSQVGPAIAKKLGIVGKETADLAKIVDSFEQTIGLNGGITSHGNLAQKEIIDCPLSIGPPEHCLQLESFLSGICEAINPDYEFTYDSMMTRGDKTCHWTIRKKGELVKEKTKGEITSEDPAKALGLRLARGEISLEDFEKTIASLKRHGVIK